MTARLTEKFKFWMSVIMTVKGGLQHRQLNYSKTSHCYPIFGNTIPARREQLAELIL
jgi:hypothetical protein